MGVLMRNRIGGKATMHRRLAKLMKDGWIKVHGSGRGTFYTIDYGQKVAELK